VALDQCPRRYDVEPVAIFDMRAGVGAAGGTSRFRCSVPDPRVWVKFGVLWVPAVVSSPTAPGAATLTLWVAAVERGGIAEQGTEYPVEDLIGTSAAPLAIPTNTALFGKFVQVKTAQTGLQAVMTVTTPTAALEGTWFAKASYYPTVDMAREEWDRLVGGIGGLAADNLIRLTV
jgi:hypothetical protein